MAIAESKTRVAITIDNGVLERLDAYCKRSGMSRSQYISYCVAHQLDVETQAMSNLTGVMRDVLAGVADGAQLDMDAVSKLLAQ